MRIRWTTVAYVWGAAHLVGLAFVALTGWVPAHPPAAIISLCIAGGCVVVAAIESAD